MSPKTSFSFRQMNRIQLVVPCLIMCAVVSTLAVKAQTWFALTTRSNLLIKAQAASTPPVKAIYFRITSKGIEPSELKLSPGRYLVAVDNDSGFNTVDLKIDKEAGPRLGTAQFPAGQRKWRGFVEFTPGKIIFSEPGNPKRGCQITITEK